MAYRKAYIPQQKAAWKQFTLGVYMCFMHSWVCLLRVRGVFGLELTLFYMVAKITIFKYQSFKKRTLEHSLPVLEQVLS